jgi:hypothetical protein
MIRSAEEGVEMMRSSEDKLRVYHFVHKSSRLSSFSANNSNEP